MTLSRSGEKVWKPLAALQPGDYIAVQRHAPVWGQGSDVVVTITDAGLQHCYDLTVPEGHAFVANGIVCHNTSFLLSVALNAAKYGARIAIFTMEMGNDQIVQRIVSMETGINSQKLRLGQLTQQEWSRFVQASGRLGNLRIFIDDSPAITPLQMRTKCRRLVHEFGLDLVIVDYLQLMNAGGQYENNRVQEIAYISRNLKELARELNVPVFTAAQLSRAVEQRQDKRPQLSDLRESGSIEQDSDIVIFLYRDVVYNEATEFPNRAEIIVSKHRNGPTGTINLHFEKSLTKFSDARTQTIDLSGL
jgi:replicative DNA helicase